MSHEQIRKLNKKLIFWSLLGLIVLAMPAIYTLAAGSRQTAEQEKKQRGPEASFYAHDAKTITGTEHFPETYSDVQGFEKGLAVEREKEQPVVEVLAAFEGNNSVTETQQTNQSNANYQTRDDDPWREASSREQKKRASDHYDARRSDIMLVNNLRNGNENSVANSDSEMMKMMDRAMAIAENSSGHDGGSKNNMLFAHKGNENKQRNDFLNQSKNSVGIVKNPSRFMLSEGTFIHAILLSEINTDLPGPILARVSNNIWDSRTGQTLLIPQNSKLIGEYNASVGIGQIRAQIVWTRIIYPNPTIS